MTRRARLLQEVRPRAAWIIAGTVALAAGSTAGLEARDSFAAWCGGPHDPDGRAWRGDARPSWDEACAQVLAHRRAFPRHHPLFSFTEGTDEGPSRETLYECPPGVGVGVKVSWLPKAEIVAAMERIRPRVEECARKTATEAMLQVSVTVLSSGTVSATTVVGGLAGTPTAACVERVVRRARFSAGDRQPLTFSYPYMVR